MPEGRHTWSENNCVAGVFGMSVDENGDDVPVSLGMIRALKTPTAEGRSCRHHVGHISLDSRGDDLPWYCGNPVSNRWYVSPMGFAVDENGDDVMVGHHKAPLWTELLYHSLDRFCGGPEV